MSRRLILTLAVLAAPAHATDLVVNPGQSIQSAIDLAADFDRVLVQPGTYFEALDMKGKRISLIGVGGALATTVDATGTSRPVVRCHSGEGGSTFLRGLTLTGGTTIAGIPGGGISCVNLIAGSAGSPQIFDCIVTGNVAAGDGGGVGGDPSMERCVVRDNHAVGGNGGGAWTGGTFARCVFAANSALNGGGAYVTGGDAPFDFCVFADNFTTAPGLGGGVYIDAGIDTELNSCVLAKNIVDGSPGDSLGGGVFIDPAGNVTFNQCSLVDNVGVLAPGGTAIDGVSGPFSAFDTILRGSATQYVPSVVGTISWSNVEGGAVGSGNFDADPLFHDASVRDYHLAPGSPCVDAGNPARTDPDGTRLDVGVFHQRSLYTRWNTDAPEYGAPGFDELPLASGGKQTLVIRAGAAHAGDLYLVVGSVSGTAPGLPILGLVVPLNLDAYTLFTLNNPGSALLPTSLGTLDGSGSAGTDFVLASGASASLAGLTVHHAAVAFRLTPALVLTTVTNAEAATLIP